jgi:hypothetical protein
LAGERVGQVITNDIHPILGSAALFVDRVVARIEALA